VASALRDRHHLRKRGKDAYDGQEKNKVTATVHNKREVLSDDPKLSWDRE